MKYSRDKNSGALIIIDDIAYKKVSKQRLEKNKLLNYIKSLEKRIKQLEDYIYADKSKNN